VALGEDADSLLAPMEKSFHSEQGQKFVQVEDLPECPSCSTALLRPAVVWFTESPSLDVFASIHTWIHEKPRIDTVLVIGTSMEVYPATSYVQAARDRGARVAVVNIDQEDVALLALGEQDWYFQGDAAVLVPEMLEPVIGNIDTTLKL
jgi:NAD-dependent deacetylase sirtuin 5